MKASVSISVNGRHVSAEVDTRRLLVEFLREDLLLTGTHVGCDTSQCGACTVLYDGKSVKACSIFAVQSSGAEIVTIEGLAKNGRLHRVQQAFHYHHALQCGFCTPGMVMSIVDLLNRIPSPTEEEVRLSIEGNLCRCTGYHNIVLAALAAARLPVGKDV
jgi:carbon-monoxide dehydrogenase small subunit